MCYLVIPTFCLIAFDCIPTTTRPIVTLPNALIEWQPIELQQSPRLYAKRNAGDSIYCAILLI